MHLFDHGEVFEIFAWKIVLRYVLCEKCGKSFIYRHTIQRTQRAGATAQPIWWARLLRYESSTPTSQELSSSIFQSLSLCRLSGPDGHTKTDEFSEKFQTAFDPPPSFSENHFTIFDLKNLVGQLKYSSAPSNIFVDFSLPSPAWLSSTAWWTSGSASRYASSSTGLSSPATTKHSPKITWKVTSDLTCWDKKTGLDICWPWQNQKLTPCCQESRSYGCKVIVFAAKALSVSTKDNQSHSNPSPDLS